MSKSVQDLAEFVKIILLQYLLLMETPACFCHLTVIINTKSSNVKKKMNTWEAQTGAKAHVRPFSFNGYPISGLSYRRSGKGRTCFIWSWSWHIFCWKIQPVLHEHHLTSCTNYDEIFNWMSLQSFPPDLTSYITIQQFFLLHNLHWPVQKQQYSRLCKMFQLAILQENYFSLSLERFLFGYHGYFGSCGV